MYSVLFWCGCVITFYELNYASESNCKITLISENIKDMEYTCEVQINDEHYIYHFTMSSNTRLLGSLFVESARWKSHVYSIDKVNDFIHVSETSTNYHDIYFLAKTNVIDIFVTDNKTSAISTLSISKKGKSYIVNPVLLPVNKYKPVYSNKSIMYLFAISGAADKLKTIVNDAISYIGPSLSLIAYAELDDHVFGIISSNKRKNIDILQCINSFYNQTYEFAESDPGIYKVNEYVTGMLDLYLKKEMLLQISSNKIVDLLNKCSYTYCIEGTNITFRKQ